MKGMNRKFHSVGASILNLPADSSTDITSVTTSTTLSGATNAQLPTALAVKTYVDTTSTGLSFKNAVKCATTTNGTLATAYANGQTVDGVTLATGDRILLKDQTSAKENGIYIVAATGAPSRATDFDTGSEAEGSVVSVMQGTTNADSAWICIGDAITVGTSDIEFAIFGGIKAGNGLAFTADVLAIDTAITADLTTAQTLTNKTVRTPILYDGDTGLTLTSADQTDASATITFPDIVGAAATVAIQDMTDISAMVTTGTPIFAIGDLDGARASTATANFIAQQVSIAQNADIGVGNTVGAAYFKTATGIAQAGQLATCMVRTAIAHDVFDSYGLQSHMDFNDDFSADAAGNLAAISGKVNIKDKTLGAGIAHAGLFIIDGLTGGTISGDADVIWAHVESGVDANQVASVLRLSTGSTVNAGIRVSPTSMTNFIDFDAVAGCVSADTGSPAATTTHKIKIDIDGTTGYIPVYADY